MDLFQDPSHAQIIHLPDAELLFYSHCPVSSSPDALLDNFLNNTPWQQDTISLYGKPIKQPRLSAWYGDDNAHYSYSGLQLSPRPWTSALHALRNDIENIAKVSFNSVLLNYYRDGNDSMGMHSDDETELGPQPIIASYTLGETRAFVLKHKTRKDLKPFSLPLSHGDLLIMRGTTQQFWQHGIRKTKKICQPRINLTFRKIIT